MLTVQLGRLQKVLLLGAHSDDIEIGCGGTILKLARELSEAESHWVVLSAHGQRADEARRSADLFLEGVSSSRVVVKRFRDGFRDGFFPSTGPGVKEFFEELKGVVSPDVILTHYGKDLHRDHRLVSELTWKTFRDHLILEYEVPKYDGDLGSPNFFVHLTEDDRACKVQLLLSVFAMQAHKHWFTEDTLNALMRLRGMESNAPSRYAEGFYCRKISY